MAVYIDKPTRARITYMKHAGDFTYDMSGDVAVSTEDVPLIGNWKDWTGEGGQTSSVQMQFASKENSLQGTDAQVEGKAKLPNLNVRGQRNQTIRQRVRKEYVGNTSTA